MTLDIHNPPTDLSLENLAQIATSLEHSAAATYCRLAAEMGKLHNPEAVQVFERLVDIQQGYEDETRAWAISLAIDLPSNEVLDDDTDVDRAERRAAQNLLLTPWQALNMAVENEQAAFEYFSGLAASAEQEDVRGQAEMIASRKLEHVALLRLERKRAWRTDARARLDALVGRDVPKTLVEFEVSSLQLLSALRALYLGLAEQSDHLGDDRAATLLRGLAADIPGTHDDEVDLSLATDVADNPDIAATLRACLRETEAAFDAYMGVAARAAAEDIVDAAHGHAAECVVRLEMLRDHLTDHIEALARS
jgi:rubrerythrin